MEIPPTSKSIIKISKDKYPVTNLGHAEWYKLSAMINMVVPISEKVRDLLQVLQMEIAESSKSIIKRTASLKYKLTTAHGCYTKSAA